MSGTDRAYASSYGMVLAWRMWLATRCAVLTPRVGMQCPVLTSGMLLPGGSSTATRTVLSEVLSSASATRSPVLTLGTCYAHSVLTSGVLLLSGEGVSTPSDTRALKYLRQVATAYERTSSRHPAAESGLAAAQYNAGRLPTSALPIKYCVTSRRAGTGGAWAGAGWRGGAPPHGCRCSPGLTHVTRLRPT
eukprot:500207-Rhodomonas_salina.2